MDEEQNHRLSEIVNDHPIASEAKVALRRAVRASRAARPSAELQAGDLARTEFALALISQLRSERVACYISVPPEPGTLELIEALDTADVSILLPILTKGTIENGRRPPAWSIYRGAESLRPGWHGIPEPTGAALPQQALAECDLIVVSALLGSVDGTRLGAGGGWYDRALVHAAPSAVVVGLLHDDELVASLPREDFDQRVHAFITPSGVHLCTN